MDVVEGVHEEMRVDLQTQVFELLCEVLPLELLHALVVFATLVIDFYAKVGYEHEDENDDAEYVVLANDGGWQVVGWCVLWRWGWRVCLPGRYVCLGYVGMVYVVGLVGALVYAECRQHDCGDGEVGYAQVTACPAARLPGGTGTAYEQRGEEEVVEEKEQEVDGELAPHEKDFVPVELHAGVVCGADVET